jgi:flagellar hook-length control protein FliK
MQILPTLNGTSQTAAGQAAGGNSLFGEGGLFGNVTAQGASLFGALMGVFGQTQATAAQAQAASIASNQMLAQAVAVQSQAQGDTATPDLAALMALLQQALAGQSLSPELKSLLSDGTPDLATLKSRLAELSDEQRDAVMAELAGLLQPLLPQAPLLQTASAESGEVILNLNAPRPATTPVASSLTNQEPENSSVPAPLAPVTANTPQDSADTQKAQAQSATATSSEASEPTTSQAQQNTNAPKAAEQAVTQISQSAAAGEAKADRSEKKSETAATILSTQATGTAAGPASREAPATKPVKAVTTTSSSEPVASTARVAESADKTTLTPQLEQAPVTTDTTRADKASFASHLETVKLNRTGAHTPVSDQIAVHLTKAAQNGQDKMTIRLQPPELGRIDIKLDISNEGMIKASIQVDQPATLDLMLRDQKGLEKALSDAGLKTDGGSLSFNLRGDGLPQRQNGGEQSQGQNSNGSDAPGFSLNGEDGESLPAGIMEMTWFIGPDRVDVRI